MSKSTRIWIIVPPPKTLNGLDAAGWFDWLEGQTAMRYDAAVTVDEGPKVTGRVETMPVVRVYGCDRETTESLEREIHDEIPLYWIRFGAHLRGVSNTNIRWAITHVNQDGVRTLTFANQGRNHYGDESRAQHALAAFQSNNGLAQILGDRVATVAVRPIACYPHGDAVSIFVDD